MSFAFLVPNSPYLFLEDSSIHLSSNGNYHQKNVWWGSLSGMFRSNIVPPVVGFESLDELLAHGPGPSAKGEDTNVLY